MQGPSLFQRIGAEIAKRPARDGFSVAVNYAANADAAQAVVAHILASNGGAAAIKADFSQSAGVEMLTLILARELRGRGITVNAVAPGPTATELFLEGKSPELIDRIAGLSPLERLGTPEEIASVVAMIASRDGDWINGQTIFANGGSA
ncbi:MAG TPA: SDR family oxidoreductase [Acidiphilium sp.]|nr:SDR family oxidoreductase [Acidiphilium sp. 20-67-58]HQU11346.1 SDR family oxidoreductase [Acidiphilium sp.]